METSRSGGPVWQLEQTDLDQARRDHSLVALFQVKRVKGIGPLTGVQYQKQQQWQEPLVFCGNAHIYQTLSRRWLNSQVSPWKKMA